MYSISQWLMISILAHMIGPVAVGQFSLGMSIAGPLAILFSLSSRMLLQMEGSDSTTAFKDYWQLRILTDAAYILSVLAIAVIRRDDAVTFWTIISICTFKAVENLSDVLCGLAQQYDHQDILSRSLFLRGITGLGAFVSGLLLGRDILFALFLVSIAWTATLILHDWRLTKPWHGSLRGWNFKAIYELGLASLPVGISVFINGFNVVVPRLFLEHFEGISALGVFSALAYALTLGNLIVGSIGNTMLTRLAKHWHSGDTGGFFQMVSKATFALLVICAIGILVAILAGDHILLLLYGPKFAGNKELLVSIAIAGTLVMVGTLWNYVLIGTKTFKFQLFANVTILILVSAVSFLAIPRFGVFGAVAAVYALGIFRIGFSVLNYFYAKREVVRNSELWLGRL